MIFINSLACVGLAALGDFILKGNGIKMSMGSCRTASASNLLLLSNPNFVVFQSQWLKKVQIKRFRPSFQRYVEDYALKQSLKCCSTLQQKLDRRVISHTLYFVNTQPDKLPFSALAACTLCTPDFCEASTEKASMLKLQLTFKAASKSSKKTLDTNFLFMFNKNNTSI